MALGLPKKSKTTRSSSRLNDTVDDFTEAGCSFREPKKLGSSSKLKLTSQKSVPKGPNNESDEKEIVCMGESVSDAPISQTSGGSLKSVARPSSQIGSQRNHSCPICSKLLSSSSLRAAHVKKCAAGNKVPPENVIKLLRGQKTDEHGQDILPSEIAKPEKKPQEKKPSHYQDVEHEDLELAMALSISMSEGDEQALMQQENNILDLGVPDLIDEQRTTRRPTYPAKSMQVKVKHIPKKRKKRTLQKHTRLTTMTQAEREAIISERVALILVSDELGPITGDSTALKGSLLRSIDETCSLWKKSSAPNQDLSVFYVPELEEYIRPQEIDVGGLLQRYSQVPGRLNFTQNCLGDVDSDTNGDMDSSIVDGYSTQLYLAELLGSQELPDATLPEEYQNVWNPPSPQKTPTPESDKNDEDIVMSEPEKSDELKGDSQNSPKKVPIAIKDSQETSSCEIIPQQNISPLKNDSPLRKIFNSETVDHEGIHSKKSDLEEDWERVYHSGEFSDLVIKTRNKEIPVHSLVLFARCSRILSEKSPLGVIDWSSNSSEAVSLFLHWMYTGNCKMADHHVMVEVRDLASKYKCERLKELLDACNVRSEDPPVPSIVGTPAQPSLIDNMPGSPDIFGDYDDDASYFHSRHSISPPVSLNKSISPSVNKSISPNSSSCRQLTYTSPAVCQGENSAIQNEVVDLTQSSPEGAKSLETSQTSQHSPEKPIDSNRSGNVAYDSAIWDDFDDIGMQNTAMISPFKEHESPPQNITSPSPPTKKPMNPPVNTSIGDSTLMAVVEDFDDDDVNNVNQASTSARISTEPVLKTPATPVNRAQHGKRGLITPMPPFKSMVTPELKKALDKYGLRQMSRNKAIKLLVHIYEEMHPLVTDSEASFCETPKSVRPRIRKLLKYPEKVPNESKNRAGVSPNKMNSSQSSQSSVDDSKEEMKEETMFMMETESDKDDIDLTQQGDLNNRILSYIKSEEDLHRKILLYEPIFFSDLLADLKNAGIKCNQSKLLDFLDEQCITFRFNKEGRSHRKTRKRQGSTSPAKKRKRGGKS